MLTTLRQMDERVVDPTTGRHPAYLRGLREAEAFFARGRHKSPSPGISEPDTPVAIVQAGDKTKVEKPAATSAFSRNEGKLSKKNASSAVRVTDLPHVANPTPPAWYSALSASDTRARGSSTSSVDELFRKIRNAITICEKIPRGQPLPEDELMKINTGIHQAFFVRFNDNRIAKNVIRGSRMLHNDSGLPRFFHLAGNGTQLPPYPFYIVADSKELYTKWWMEDLNPNLYREIVEGRPENAKLGRSKETDKLDPMYPNRVTGTFHGNGPLLNGQWWPSQLCAVRDGAHNSSIAGISGNECDGAWSVIVAVAPNIDQGDEIWYCGTGGRNGEKTAATALMFENITSKQPVRVVRSSKGKGSQYRPAQGYRYDGLYDVLGSTLLNADKAHYRFHLKRQSGQDLIRWTGPGARPTPEEIIAFQTHKVEIKYRV